MGRVVRARFGRYCIECDEQIDPRRVRIRPDVKLCRDCQTEDEMRRQRQLQATTDKDIVIIRCR